MKGVRKIYQAKSHFEGEPKFGSSGCPETHLVLEFLKSDEFFAIKKIFLSGHNQPSSCTTARIP